MRHWARAFGLNVTSAGQKTPVRLGTQSKIVDWLNCFWPYWLRSSVEYMLDTEWYRPIWQPTAIRHHPSPSLPKCYYLYSFEGAATWSWSLTSSWKGAGPGFPKGLCRAARAQCDNVRVHQSFAASGEGTCFTRSTRCTYLHFVELLHRPSNSNIRSSFHMNFTWTVWQSKAEGWHKDANIFKHLYVRLRRSKMTHRRGHKSYQEPRTALDGWHPEEKVPQMLG